LNSRERHGLQPAEFVLQGGQHQIFGTEIVAPLRDAVRLIDRQQTDLGTLEKRDRVRLGEPLRRHIDEAQRASRDLLQDAAVFVEVIRGVEARGGNAVAPQLRHLVAHQRDERRYDNREPIAHQRRQLVAQRLAAARGHHGEHVVASQNRCDDFVLASPERGKAEHGAQEVVGGGEIGHG
jgi:hypothetical protein